MNLRISRWISLAVVVGVLVGVAAWVAPRVAGVAGGDRDWSGEVVYVPAYPVSTEALEDIDLEALHADLIPIWLSRVARHGPDSGSTKQALAAIEASIAPDPNLGLLMEEMAELVRRPARDPERLLYLTWAWSTYLDRAGFPWVLQGSVRLDESGGGLFYTKNYEVVADLSFPVGSGDVRARLVERVDRTNVVERYLGQASDPDQGALIVVDRVRDVALDLVWPMLDPHSANPHARAISAQAQQALSEPSLLVLRQTAGDRGALVAAARMIRSRQACGSTFVLPGLAFDGFSPMLQSRLFEYVEASTGSRCPTVTQPEALAVERSSQALQARPGLESALEELVAWVAVGVVVHEARHIADVRDGLVVDGGYPCADCDDGLSDWARAEASAYLASAAEPGGTVTLAEMCLMAEQPEELPVHYATAVAQVLARLGPVICAEPPASPVEVARDLEEDWFGRSERIVLPAFPNRLRAVSRKLDRHTSF